MTVLGIETSCDETAAAICQNKKILSNTVRQQIVHAEFGGVVPEIASREHEILLNTIVHHTLDESNIHLRELDAISVTQGPGLAGTLLTGISFAKGLGIGLNIPVIPVNHLEGHIFANLLVSGVHRQLWNIIGMEHYELLGETRDDAAGEAFDKGARILGLEYPGGPAIERGAKGGDPDKIQFPRSLMGDNSLEFSFSGLKTSLLYFMDDFEETASVSLKDVIASFQQAIVDTLAEKVKRAIKKTGVKRCVIAGGVAANLCLRDRLNTVLSNKHILFPDLSYCTDNAAMICYLGELKMQSYSNELLSFSAQPNLKLG